MGFEHDDRKPYEFIWFLIASGGAGFLPPPVEETREHNSKQFTYWLCSENAAWIRFLIIRYTQYAAKTRNVDDFAQRQV